MDMHINFETSSEHSYVNKQEVMLQRERDF